MERKEIIGRILAELHSAQEFIRRSELLLNELVGDYDAVGDVAAWKRTQFSMTFGGLAEQERPLETAVAPIRDEQAEKTADLLANNLVKFTEKEISQMSITFKRQFIANGLVTHIRKIKSGKNTICYEIRYRSNGYYITASSTDLAEAKRKFIAKTKPGEIEKYRVQVGSTGLSKFCDVFQEWLDYKENVGTINEKGIQRFKADFNSLSPKLQKMPIENIRTGTLSEAMKGIKPRKYEELRTLFNGIFKYAIASGIVSRNPVTLIPFKRAERQNREALSKEEIEAFLKNITLAQFAPIKQGAYLLYFFGLRPCEVDEETRREGDFLIVRNRKRKNGKIEYKKIPIPKQAQGLIDWGAPLTFQCEEYDRPKHFKKLFNSSGKTAYNLRHTFSTLCQEASVPQEVVEVWLGDSPQRLIGKVYTHYSDEYMRSQMDLVTFPILETF